MTPESAGSSRHPALSVAIPTRDRGDVMRRSAESALQSLRPDIEVIVVVDGSSDDTEVEKHRMRQSISHSFDGYIDGLDAQQRASPTITCRKAGKFSAI